MTKFKLGTGNARGAPKSSTKSMFAGLNASALKAKHGSYCLTATFLGAPTSTMSAQKDWSAT